MAYLGWDQIPEKTNGEGRFLKWKQGKNRIRLIGKLQSYDQEWPSGMATRYVHLVMDVDDGNKVKIATLKKSTLDSISTYAQEIGDPAGAEAPGFIVILKGSGMDSKYQCISGSKSVPIPSEIDVAAEQRKLDEFVEKQCAKLGGNKQYGAESEPLKQEPKLPKDEPKPQKDELGTDPDFDLEDDE